MTATDRLIHWLGKFHLLLLHFPIALILAAGVAELREIGHRNSSPSEVVRFCLRVGAWTAVPTAGLGWLFATTGLGVGAPQLLMVHRWLGTITAVWLVITAFSADHDTRQAARSWRTRCLLASGILFIALTAHLGGLLAHGNDFFAF